MISADMIMCGIGTLSILGAIYLIITLMFRKSIWNYPPIVSIYIFLAIFFLFYGIVFIYQIKITSTIGILTLVAIIIWGYITFRLPARRQG